MKMLLPLLLLAGSAQLLAQTVVSGTVKDASTQEALAGVNIIVKGKVVGTITDSEGKYTLKVSQAPPFTLTFSFIGFHTEDKEVTDANTTLDLTMNEESLLGQEVVVSASRVEENILKSPVTIEKLDIIAIKQAATPDFYDALANMKGVQVNNGSLNFTAVNTRGFATIANTRFVQWVDGMDTQAPLLNFPTGSIMGLGELDAESLELIPGAASALYGPNAFNGIMIMKSKSPFEYQGLSAQVKQGITNSNAGGSNPYGMYSIRYAHAFNNKFAFKVNFSYMKATDWTANDYKTDRINPSSTTDLSSSPNFDGLNKYGDEAKFDVPIGPPFGTLNLARTGFKESVLLDNRDAKTIKGDVALHYRINDKMELIGAYRYGGGNSLYQGQAKYALRDFNQQFYKLELKGDNFFVRGYLSATDAGKSYNMDALGAYTNEALSPTSTQWAPEYAQAYVLSLQGYTPGVPAGNTAAAHAAARAYADRNIFDANGNITAATQSAINTVRSNFFQKNPAGASFYDNSKLWHAEVYYNFNKIKWAEVIAGGNFRQYSLFSNATIFDEAPVDASNPKRIFINQYGAYVQMAKTIAEKLKLTASLRVDKSDNFDAHVTPRISAVYSVNSTSSFRASFQTGFRNPDTQAQYIYFNNPTGILLGGVPSNASRYGIYNGGAWTQASYADFASKGGTIDPTTGAVTSNPGNVTLQVANVGYVKPEQLWSYEVGYKGVIATKVLVDLNYYYSSYTNFLGEQYVVSSSSTTHQGTQINAGSLWYPYTNSPYTLTSQGIGLGITYNLPKSFVLMGNYNYASFSGQTSSDFQANFNTPQNRYSIGLGNRKIVKNLAANVNFRYQDSFLWESSYGVATIPSYGVFDAQLSYKVTSMKSIFKIGGTNLGGKDYRTNFGSPFIGQMYYVSITFDEFLK
jgi:outer membrane receptor protein involved in Fe transport